MCLTSVCESDVSFNKHGPLFGYLSRLPVGSFGTITEDRKTSLVKCDTKDYDDDADTHGTISLHGYLKDYLHHQMDSISLLGTERRDRNVCKGLLQGGTALSCL
jgi:hypothetical protein